MTTSPTEPTLRESVDELVVRLGRICAATATLRHLAPDIRHGIPPHALVRLTEDLDRDLMLASRELGVVHDRALREIEATANYGTAT